jgi:hypothetical protein
MLGEIIDLESSFSGGYPEQHFYNYKDAVTNNINYL